MLLSRRPGTTAGPCCLCAISRQQSHDQSALMLGVPQVCWGASMGLRGTFAWDGDLDDNQELLRSVRQRSWGAPRQCPNYKPDACPPRPKGVTCPASPPPAGPGGNSTGCTYKIASRDSFDVVATRLGVPLSMLLSLNPGVEPTKLQIGQLINVPCAPSTPAGQQPPARPVPASSTGCTYKIAHLDTFNAVAARLGVPPDSILSLNPGVEPTKLQIGQLINVPCSASG